MDAERTLVDGLRRAAEHAPAFDDALLPEFQEPGRRRPLWRGLAAAASVLVVVGIAVWAGLSSSPGTAVPAAGPAASSPGADPWPLPAADGIRPLIGTTWVVSRMQPTGGVPKIDAKTPLSQRPWVRLLADGTVQGDDGCNQVSGRYHLDGATIRFDELGTTLAECVDHPGQGFVPALRSAVTVQLGVSALALQHDDGLQVLSFRPLNPTDEAAPGDVRLRLANNTGKDVVSVSLRAPGLSLAHGSLRAGATSEELLPDGPVYSYARVDVTYADGSTDVLVPTDFVGEDALPPGRWTYVLSVARGPERTNDSSLVIGLEESGRPAGQR